MKEQMKEEIKYAEIGKIINTHGLKGEVKILPYSIEPKSFKDYKKILVKGASGIHEYEVASVKIIKNTAVLRLLGVFDIDSAEALKGCIILVNKDDIPELPEDCFYVKDLVGCQVIDHSFGPLGVVKEVIATGSNDVYIVGREGKADLLIPALKAVIESVDLTQKIIKVSLPNGLLEIYE